MEGIGKMIYLDPKLDLKKSSLPILDRVSYVYQEFLSQYDHDPKNLVCYVHPTECLTDKMLVTPEGIRIIPWSYMLTNHYYFVPQN